MHTELTSASSTCTYMLLLLKETLPARSADAQGCASQEGFCGAQHSVCRRRATYCGCFSLRVPRLSKPLLCSGHMCSVSHCPFSEVPSCLGHWPVPSVQPHGAHTCFFSFPGAGLLSAHAAHCHLSSVLASVLLRLPTLSFSSTSFPQATLSGTARARSLSPG